MNTEPLTVEAFIIRDVPGLDPITVILQDVTPAGRGAKLTVEVFGAAWSSFWGSPGDSLRAFVLRSSRDYIADNLIWSRRQFITNERALERERKYLLRIVDAVKAALDHK